MLFVLLFLYIECDCNYFFKKGGVDLALAHEQKTQQKKGKDKTSRNQQKRNTNIGGRQVWSLRKTPNSPC